jgi:hypothetical protein
LTTNNIAKRFLNLCAYITLIRVGRAAHES